MLLGMMLAVSAQAQRMPDDFPYYPGYTITMGLIQTRAPDTTYVIISHELEKESNDTLWVGIVQQMGATLADAQNAQGKRIV